MILDLLVIAMVLATIGSYAWSVRFHFRSGDLDRLARILAVMVALGGVGLSLITVLYNQPAWAQVTGLVLMAAALGLFWWSVTTTRRARLLAVFTDDAPHTLVMDGPYSFVRHPFYTSYIVFWGGFALATASLVGLPVFAAFYLLYDRAARDEEKRFLESDLADNYRAFCETRNRFFALPKFT